MSLVEHIQELRRRLLISLAALFVGTIIGFLWYQHSVPGIIPLGELLRGPYCQLNPSLRADFSADGSCRLLATAPFEMFTLRLKVGALAGIVISSPVWLAQIWGFLTPGLLKNERRWTLTFVTLAVLLFVAGAVLAYFVMSFGLEVLLSIGRETQITALSGQSYYSFFIALLLVFGVSFEVPLIIAMLNIVGLLEYEVIKDKRRVIIMFLFVFAAFMTPGQDPMSMLALGVSLCVLVELAMQFCRINDNRKGRQRPDWMDIDDEEASQLDLTPGGVDSPSPISAPTERIEATPSSMIRGNKDLGNLAEKQTSAFDDVL